MNDLPPEQTPTPSPDEQPQPAGRRATPPPIQREPVGWYNGPFPPPGFRGAESLGRTLLRTVVGSIVILAGIGIGFVALIAFVVAIFAVIGAASRGGGGNATGSDRLGAVRYIEGRSTSKNQILSIEVTGIILGDRDRSTGLFGDLSGAAYGYEIRRQLEDAANEPSVKAVVLELSTPGGTIFGASAIAEGVREYRERTGKPVLAFVKGLSASGGMWAMSPASRILADRGSLIGSIGVITGPFTFYDGVTATDGGLLGGGITTRNGIEYSTITAGRGKDMGSPYRRLTDEERNVLQQGVNNAYDQFVRQISTTRNIPEATIRDRIGALVYDEGTAQTLGLIDGTAGRPEAYAEAARLAGLPGTDWKVVRKQTAGGVFAALFSRLDPHGWGMAKQETPVAQSCFPPHAVLAYYGDPGTLCPPLGR